jgi:polyvinyl alcohol dehydrogenase (cytochrome)
MRASRSEKTPNVVKLTLKFCCKILLAASLLLSSAMCAQNGQALYQSHCAMCHEMANTAPFMNHHVLKAMAPENIVSSLTSGPMRSQGTNLSQAERVAIAEFLTGKRVGQFPPAGANRCANPAAKDFSGPRWNGWGVDLDNSRFQPADAAQMSAEQVPKLKLKWAFGFPAAFTAYAQPVVAGGRVFVGSAAGLVYSLDAATGCTYWSFQADGGVRTAITIGPGNVAYFGDLRAEIYALDATTGKLLWKKTLDPHPVARITGSPKLFEGRLYVPVSSREEWAAADAGYRCCTFRGSIVALDATTGKEIWRTYTVKDLAHLVETTQEGVQIWGPSGGAIWSSPAIDPKRKLLYVGTGDGYTRPSTPFTDAILALDLATGKIIWSRQVTPQDDWNTSCFQPGNSNCPKDAGPDYDFGSSPILRTLPDGRNVVLASQKSGVIYALDPDKKGEIVWQARLGKGGVLGGIQWGPAADGEAAYVAISDVGAVVGPEGIQPDPKMGGGLFAVQISTGKKLWSALPSEEGCHTPRCSPGQLAAVTAIPGVVFSGSLDGHFRAYSTQDGRVLWDYDTLREFPTVNQVPAKGGSLDGAGAAVAGGMVFVNSGYGHNYEIPGNVLLAFGVE